MSRRRRRSRRSRLRLRPGDALRTAAGSLRSRAWRAALSALGHRDRHRRRGGRARRLRLLPGRPAHRAGCGRQPADGAAGQDVTGAPAPLPGAAPGMIARIPPVQTVTAVGYVPGALVRRTAAVPAVDSGGISVLATQTSLLHTLGGQVARGVFLNAATVHYPAVVLGAVAARTLGITRVPPGHAGVPGRAVLHGDRHPAAGAARAGDRRGRAGRVSRSPTRGSAWAATRPRSTCAPSRTRCRRWRRCCRSPRTRPCPRRCRSACRLRCSRRGRRPVGAYRAVPRGWARSRWGRRGGHRQRDGGVGAGTPGRDRAAAGARRGPPARRRPVPDRVAGAGHLRRRGRARSRGRGHRRVRGQYRAGGGRAARRRRGRPGPWRSPWASRPGSTRPAAPPGSLRPRPCVLRCDVPVFTSAAPSARLALSLTVRDALGA